MLAHATLLFVYCVCSWCLLIVAPKDLPAAMLVSVVLWHVVSIPGIADLLPQLVRDAVAVDRGSV